MLFRLHWLLSRFTQQTTFAIPVVALAGLLLPVAATAETPAPATARPVKVSPELTELVLAYFTTHQRDERRAIVPLIKKAAQRDARAVAKAIHDVDLWSAGPEGPASIFFPEPGRPSVAGVFEVPFGYHSQERYPLLVCIPDAGLAPEVTLVRARLFLKKHITEFIVLGTTAKIIGGFNQGADGTSKIETLIKKLSKLVRIDRNRIYVLGVGEGANAAWQAGITHPDLFAGVISINGYPELPYPEQSYPLLLENLRHTPVLSVWNKPPAVSSTEQSTKSIIAKHNRMIAKLATETSLPIRSMEVPTDARPDRQPPVAAISDIVSLDRVTTPKKISHWFRYPDHGASAWLRQLKFSGPVWTEPAISIKAGPGVDRNKFIQDVLRSKLAYVGGVLEDRKVTLTVKHTSGVELALPMGAFNPADSIQVVCNGRIRHDGRLEPDIRAMLESAYDRWDFQNPVAATLPLSVKAD